MQQLPAAQQLQDYKDLPMTSRLSVLPSSDDSDSDDLPESAIQRGIQNPMVIDLIEGVPDQSRVEISMIEFREDTDDFSRLKEIELKYNACLEYILGGHFLSQYPAYEDCEVTVVYQHSSEPRGQTLPLLQAMQKAAVQHGLQFETRAYTGSAQDQ